MDEIAEMHFFLMKLRNRIYLSPTSAHVVWSYPLHSSSPIEVTTCIPYVGTTNRPTDLLHENFNPSDCCLCIHYHLCSMITRASGCLVVVASWWRTDGARNPGFDSQQAPTFTGPYFVS